MNDLTSSIFGNCHFVSILFSEQGCYFRDYIIMLRFGPGVSRHLRYGQICGNNILTTHNISGTHHGARDLSSDGANHDSIVCHERNNHINPSTIQSTDDTSSYHSCTTDGNQELSRSTHPPVECIPKIEATHSTDLHDRCVQRLGAVHNSGNILDRTCGISSHERSFLHARCAVRTRNTIESTLERNFSTLTTKKLTSQSNLHSSFQRTRACLHDDSKNVPILNHKNDTNGLQNKCNVTDGKGVDGMETENAQNQKAMSDASNTCLTPGSLLAATATGEYNELGNHDNKNSQQPLVPPDPESCCGSGCVNCVYIKYVQELLARDPNDRGAVQDVLDEIEDYNVKMFIKLELGL